MAWEKVTGFAPLWSGKSGESVDAYIKAVNDGKFGKNYTVMVSVPHDLTVIIGKDMPDEVRHFEKGDLVALPSHKVLTNVLDQCNLEERVRITAGDEKPNANKAYSPVKMYGVERWKN